jgi:hypothetical protein
LAAGVLYPFLLGPSIAALAMSGSSALVAINALMLKRTKLTGIRQSGKAAPPSKFDVTASLKPGETSAVAATPEPTKATVVPETTQQQALT